MAYVKDAGQLAPRKLHVKISSAYSYSYQMTAKTDSLLLETSIKVLFHE